MSFRRVILRSLYRTVIKNSSLNYISSQQQIFFGIINQKLLSKCINNYQFRKCSNTAYEHTPEKSGKSDAIGKIQPKLFLAFTCKVCNARIEKHISKVAYTKGVVIVRCDGCEENHLIADNLGWFPDLKSMRNIEDIMKAQGETVKKTLEDSPEKTN